MPEVMRPGDKILIGLPPGTALGMIEPMKERLRDRFPGVEPVILIGFVGAVIYRPEGAPDA